MIVWRRRAVVLVAVALVAALLVAGLGSPQIRNRLEGKSSTSFSHITSGRSKLVTRGLKIVEHHPVLGVGVGGFKHAYAEVAHLRGKEPKAAASHTTPITVTAETGLPGLALLLWLAGTALAVGFRRLGPGFAGTLASRLRSSLDRDPRALPVLQRALRRSDHLGAPRAGRARRARGTARRGSPRVISHVRRALVLAPHTDDGEFGCGGTMARLVEAGADVRYVAFSIATRSLPEGFPPDTLAQEVREATAEIGIPAENLTVHDFDVRTFPDHRQEILELLIELWNDWQPDIVFQPSVHDVHQDHRTIADEGLRAFKRTTILGYEIPWNNFDFSYQAYLALEQRHVERKVAALERYASQQHRRYANGDYVWSVARTHGVNVNREYAEVFQVYRVVA